MESGHKERIKGECLRLLQRNDVGSKTEEEMKMLFEKRGLSNSGIRLRMCTEDLLRPEIEKRSEEIQTQEREKTGEREKK